MNLNDITCLITGASGGIGAAIARALDDRGTQLILVGRRMPALEELNATLGNRHQLLCADISSEEGRQEITARVAADDSLRLVIQSAGISSFNRFEHQTEQEMEQSLKVNLLAPMLITHALLPLFLARKGGTIVNVGSAFGSIGFPCFSTYCASKFGLRGFSESLQRELAGTPVDVRYFAPRATQTTFNSPAIDGMNEALGNKVDTPETVAAALIRMLESNKRRAVVGWPEKLFCRLNGLWPELVDRDLAKKRQTIIDFARQSTV